MPNFIEIGGGSRKFSTKLVDLTRNDPFAVKNLNINWTGDDQPRSLTLEAWSQLRLVN